MMHIRIQSCRLRDVDNIYLLSQTLAHYFPQPEQFVTAIYELLLNAVEHGNLEIGSKKKGELLYDGTLRDEIERRLDMPEYARKEVEIKISHDDSECRLVIADQGGGFPWKDYIDNRSDEKAPHGRGLWIAFNSQFDYIAFNAAGNEVTCVKYAHASDAEPVMRKTG